MGKYDLTRLEGKEVETSKVQVLGWILNELAESNRLKRYELNLLLLNSGKISITKLDPNIQDTINSWNEDKA